MRFRKALECFIVQFMNLTSAFRLQGLLLAGILVNEARLGRNDYFKIAPKELRYGCPSHLEFLLQAPSCTQYMGLKSRLIRVLQKLSVDDHFK